MVEVNFYAGAAEAAGVDQTRVGQNEPATLADLVSILGRDNPILARVLTTCSFLLDGQRVPLPTPLPQTCTVDVLPPFAGG
jgi:molybdopterin converting factor small subunit